MRQLVLSSHWFYHCTRNAELTDEESENTIRVKSSFGWYVRGLSTGRLIKRDIQPSDFPIENNGTYATENYRTTFKVCCQEFIETVLAFFYYPVTGRAVLVRISPKRVSKSFFYWELVVLLQKIVLLIIATRFSDLIQDVQLIVTLLMLCIFLAMQVKNEPYFLPRLNRLHQLTIMAPMIYCLCRIIIAGLVEVNFGGQVDPYVKFNINVPAYLYEYTRSYINVDGVQVQSLIQITTLLNRASLFIVVVFWLRILFDHFCFYLVMMEDKEVELTALSKGTNKRDAFSIEEQEILAKQGKE